MTLEGKIKHGVELETESAGKVTCEMVSCGGMTLRLVSVKSNDMVIAFGPIGSYVDLSGYYTSSQTNTLLGGKVDKEIGRGLSSNDYTDAEKTKLSGIAAGAEVNVNADWSQSDSSADDYIKNKPTLASVATSGSYNDLTNKPSIPSAQVQSDWSQSNSNEVDYIKNKPTIPAAQVNADWNASSGVAQILNKPTIPTVPTNVSAFTNDAGYLTQHQSLANYYTKTEINAMIGDIETLLASI